MRTLWKSRWRSVLLAVLLAAIYLALNYPEIVHRSAILRTLDPAFPASRYRRSLLDVNRGGTRALAHVDPLACERSFDIELSWRDGWWWMERLSETSDPFCP